MLRRRNIVENKRKRRNKGKGKTKEKLEKSQQVV